MSMSQQDFETAAHTMKKVMLGQGLHQKTIQTRRIPEHQKTPFEKDFIIFFSLSITEEPKSGSHGIPRKEWIQRPRRKITSGWLRR